MRPRSLLMYYIMPLIAPTLLITELVKVRAGTRDRELLRKKALKRLFDHYLLLSSLLALILFFWPYFSVRTIFRKPMLLLFFYYALSRTVEIFISFLLDSLEKMRERPLILKGLTCSERYLLALKSYLELIIDFGIIYYLVNILSREYFSLVLFDTDFENIVEAIYYSVNTATILGFGDLSPTHYFSQLATVFQVITGVLLLIINFTVYVSLNFAAPISLKPEREERKGQGHKRGTPLLIFQVLLIMFILFLAIKRL